MLNILILVIISIILIIFFLLFFLDFHHECRKMNYGAINKLVDQVDNLLQSYKEFSMNTDDSKIKLQSGVIRTNCNDFGSIFI